MITEGCPRYPSDMIDISSDALPTEVHYFMTARLGGCIPHTKLDHFWERAWSRAVRYVIRVRGREVEHQTLFHPGGVRVTMGETALTDLDFPP